MAKCTGYRTYDLDFEDNALGLGVNLRWHGFIVGGAVLF